MQIPIAHPLIGQEEADAVLSVLASGMNRERGQERARIV